MSTVRDLIKGSMRLIGVIAAGETPTAAELADGLSSLNDMVASWSNEGLWMYTKTREEFSFVSGTQSYTLGAGGTFNSSRPVSIEHVTIELQTTTPNLEVPVDIINQAQWSAIVNKSQLSDIPTRVYDDGGFPLRTLSFWPTPSATNKAVIYSAKPLTAFATVDTAIELPPGYLRALKYNHALEMSPEFGKEPSMLVIAAAEESKENIKRINSKPHYLATNEASGGTRFNIYTGE